MFHSLVMANKGLRLQTVFNTRFLKFIFFFASDVQIYLYMHKGNNIALL